MNIRYENAEVEFAFDSEPELYHGEWIFDLEVFHDGRSFRPSKVLLRRLEREALRILDRPKSRLTDDWDAW